MTESPLPSDTDSTSKHEGLTLRTLLLLILGMAIVIAAFFPLVDSIKNEPLIKKEDAMIALAAKSPVDTSSKAEKVFANLPEKVVFKSISESNWQVSVDKKVLLEQNNNKLTCSPITRPSKRCAKLELAKANVIVSSKNSYSRYDR